MEFANIVKEALDIEINTGEANFLTNTDEFLPVKIGFSLFTFAIRTMIRKVLVAVFFGFIGGLIISGAAWTRNG